MAVPGEKFAGRDRWLLAIGVLLAISLVLFLVVVILNGGTILVGIFLTVFQVALSVISFALFILLSLWILKAIGDSEGRIKKNLEALQKTLLRATYKVGSDILSLVTGLLAYVIQEAVADYPRLNKISICVLFTLDFFLASQLIGSERPRDKVMGIIFFACPVVLFGVTVLTLTPRQSVLSWLGMRSIVEISLMLAVLMSTLLTFFFAFLKQRDV